MNVKRSARVAVVRKVYSLHDRLDLGDVDKEGGAHTREFNVNRTIAVCHTSPLRVIFELKKVQ